MQASWRRKKRHESSAANSHAAHAARPAALPPAYHAAAPAGPWPTAVLEAERAGAILRAAVLQSEALPPNNPCWAPPSSRPRQLQPSGWAGEACTTAEGLLQHRLLPARCLTAAALLLPCSPQLTQPWRLPLMPAASRPWCSASKVAQLQAAKALALMAAASRQHAMAVAAGPGFLPACLRMFVAGDSMAAREAAAQLLMCVMTATPDQVDRAIIRESGVDVPFLASLLRGSRSSVLLQAAATLLDDIMFGGPQRDAAAAAAAMAAGIVPSLVRLLYTGEVSSQVVAASGLRNLASTRERQDAIVAAGAVPQLVRLLGSTAEAVQEAASAVLHNLTAGDCSAEDLLAFMTAGAIPALVDLVHSGTTTDLRETSAVALANLVVAGSEGAAAVTVAGGEEALQAALEREDATDRLKHLAAGALQLVRLHESLQANR